MCSKKRFEKAYGGGNPFGLARNISARIRACAKSHGREHPEQLNYLWVHVSEDGSDGNGSETMPRPLTVEEWLSVIDEAAALGAKCLCISLKTTLTERPDVVRMCKWAQDPHDMLVGLHIADKPFTRDDLSLLMQLDPAKTCLFVEDSIRDAMGFVADMGYEMNCGQDLNPGSVPTTCTAPLKMPCIGSCGSMYTCGLVLGDEHYLLGSVFDRRLEDIMTDEHLPHAVPEGVPKNRRTCSGCPPLMAERVSQHFRH